MRTVFCILVFLCLLMQSVAFGQQATLEQRLDNLAKQIADNLTENQKHTIAVVEFSDLKGSVSNFGRFVSEELITRLYQTRKFKVIERQQLNKIIAEQKLSLSGVVDPSTAQKLGRVLGVDSIVFGSISDLVRNLKINARLISAETGEVFAAAAIDIVKDDAVTSLMADGGASNTERQGSDPASSSSKSSKTWRIDSHFFTFDLQRCRLSGTSVLCEFTITNNDRDRRLAINNRTRMFDDFGNESEGRNYQIADKTGVYGVEAALITGVPVKARMTFEGISPQATRMTLFHLQWYSEGDFVVEYRNIPLRESPANGGAGSENSLVGGSNRQTTIQVSPGQWIDSGIEVEPGMKVTVTVSGTLTSKSDNRAVSDVLSGVLKQRVNVPPSTKSINAKALLAKIHYGNGGESRTITMGPQTTLTVEKNESGRLYFGVDTRYAKSEGSFSVTVSW